MRQYAKCWIIETDYRCTGVFKAVSNSRNPQTRILLFSLAVALNVLWVVTSTLSNLLKIKIIRNIAEEMIFQISQNYTLAFTGRWFKRYLRIEIIPLKLFQKEVA